MEYILFLNHRCVFILTYIHYRGVHFIRETDAVIFHSQFTVTALY